MAKDLNNEQSVATQDLKDVDVVNQQDLNSAGSVDQQNQDEKLADGTDSNKPVPYSRLKEATDAKNEAEESKKVAEEQAAHAQRQLELIQQQQVANANPVQAPKSSMDQALAECGITADEMYGAEIPRVMQRKDEIDRANLTQQQAVLGVQQFMINHPDINQVVGSVNPATGQIVAPSAEVMALVAKKPYLRQSTTEAIYDAVIESRELAEFKKTQAANEEHLNRQGLDNDLQPLGGSAAGGGGGGDVNQPMMSREQQQEIRRKVEAGETV